MLLSGFCSGFSGLTGGIWWFRASANDHISSEKRVSQSKLFLSKLIGLLCNLDNNPSGWAPYRDLEAFGHPDPALSSHQQMDS